MIDETNLVPVVIEGLRAAEAELKETEQEFQRVSKLLEERRGKVAAMRQDLLDAVVIAPEDIHYRGDNYAGSKVYLARAKKVETEPGKFNRQLVKFLATERELEDVESDIDWLVNGYLVHTNRRFNGQFYVKSVPEIFEAIRDGMPREWIEAKFGYMLDEEK